ncbi:hypothetical protein XIS1_490012 [Xenorhabdus innexi]|uniref:Uncharacterized protein n=1 Tax=Xenorhabdus innexi TaxID=290109 RepID=A0A1N6MYU4_9GAMM|nr:hypothetical protein XIS1_490012 [Xenorhabdus innexi]
MNKAISADIPVPIKLLRLEDKTFISVNALNIFNSTFSRALLILII